MKKGGQSSAGRIIYLTNYTSTIEYFRGVAQLVARDIWEHRLVSPHTRSKPAEKPSTVRISGGSENEKSS